MIKDMTNQKFGEFTVIKFNNTNKKTGAAMWLCECSCGNQRIIDGRELRRGKTKSCGCLRPTYLKNAKHVSYIKHGLSNTNLFKVWGNMKDRCYNIYHKSYKNYGGRGIIVCEEWLDKENGFINFYNWTINNGYQKGLSIDRKDNNGNYEPDNCRWATSKEQMNNTRKIRFITIDNETKSMSEWSEISGVNRGVIRARLDRGYQGKDLIKPIKQYRKRR
jgi:hypothetical protein